MTSVTLTSSGAAGTATVGPYPIVPSSPVGTGLSNYTITLAGGTLTVNPAALTITAANQSKTYGQSLTLGTTLFTTSGLVNGDTVTGVTLTSAGAPATANVGSYAIAPSSPVGTGLSNYTITLAGGTLTVNPAALTITAANQSKTYGQSLTLGTTLFTASGLVNGDTVTGVTLTSNGVAATANVGTYAIVPASPPIGTGLANYTITLNNGTLIVNPAALTAGLTGTVGKIYDGTTTASGLTAANYTLAGILNGDAVTLNNPTTGIYATKNVGSGILVTVTGLALNGGGGAANYLLASTTAAGNIGTISPALLTAGLTGIVRKQFDGNTDATMTPGNYTLAGLVAGDSVILNAPARGQYAAPDPGIRIPVSVSGLAISGPAAANYTLANPTATAPIGEIFTIPVFTLINHQPLPVAQEDLVIFHLLFGGAVPCLPSRDDNTQQVMCMPLVSGFGITTPN